jgi:hypothetical protein
VGGGVESGDFFPDVFVFGFEGCDAFEERSDGGLYLLVH